MAVDKLEEEQVVSKIKQHHGLIMNRADRSISSPIIIRLCDKNQKNFIKEKFRIFKSS